MGRVRRYAEIAAFANARGYPDVDEWAVKNWLKKGLIPRTHGPRPADPTARLGSKLEARILEVCAAHFNEGIRSLEVVVAVLWSRGSSFPEDDLKRSLKFIADGPGRLLMATRAPSADLWDVANIAVHERGFGAEAIRDGVSKGDLAAGLGDLMAMFAGEIPLTEAADEDLDAVGVVIGLDRASRDRLPGMEAWLPTSAAPALRQAAANVGVAPLSAAIDRASPSDLAWARDAADIVATAVLRAVEQLAAAGDREFAGFGRYEPVLRSPVGRVMVALALLATPAEGQKFVALLSQNGAPTPRN